MATQQNVAHKDQEVLPEEFLRSLTIKVCIIRLVLLGIIFTLIASTWINIIPPVHYFIIYKDLYILFFVAGFGINILYLLSWNKFQSVYKFIRIQLISDIFFALYLIFLTGGLKSAFSFLIVVVIFLYGRIFGLKSSFIISTIVILFYSILLFLQLKYPYWWGVTRFVFTSLLFFYFLNFVAICLINILLYLTKSQERGLVFELISQEIALSHAEALKKSIFDSVESLIFVLSESGEIISLNKKAVEFLDRKKASFVIGKKIEFFSSELADIFNNNLENKNIFKVVLKGRKFWAKVSYLPGENIYIFFLNDVTEQEELQEKIFQMEKMASLGELAAGIAHEIKNPLAGIKASLQLLQDEQDKVLKDRLFRIVLNDIDRLDKLVKDFLAFAKPKKAVKEEVRVGDVIQDVLFLLRMKLKDVDIVIVPGVEKLIFYWSKEQLKQVVLNLLVNAIEASLDGGKKIFIKAEINKNEQKLIIEDTGHGLSDEEKRRAFEPFFTTKKKGTGLGLSIALRLCHLNESSLEFDHGVKKGCRVVLSSKRFKRDDI
ncbi:two-component system sensor histidine kinase NtrB [Desulfonauticus submarinus]